MTTCWLSSKLFGYADSRVDGPSQFGHKPHRHGIIRKAALCDWLLLGSGVVSGPSGDQAGNEGTGQGFAAPTSVVHELEEAEIQGGLTPVFSSTRR